MARVRNFLSAAMRGGWPKMSMRRLRKIVQEHGGKDVEQANEYVEKLKSEKRYKRDVY